MGHRGSGFSEQATIGLVEPNAVSGEHRTVERAVFGQERSARCTPFGGHQLALGLGLVEVDVEERVDRLRPSRDLGTLSGRQIVDRVGGEAHADPIGRVVIRGVKRRDLVDPGLDIAAGGEGSDDPRGHDQTCAGLPHSVDDRLLEEVHLATGRDAGEQHLHRTQRHAGACIVGGHPSFERPHRFLQPPLEREAIAHGPDKRHRRVGVGVHQTGHQQSADPLRIRVRAELLVGSDGNDAAIVADVDHATGDQPAVALAGHDIVGTQADGFGSVHPTVCLVSA